MALIGLRCASCGRDMVLDDSLTQGFCMFCGARIQNGGAAPAEAEADRSGELADLIDLGITSVKMCDLEKAQLCADKALEIDPDCPDAWYLKGVSFTSKDQSAIDRQTCFDRGSALSSKMKPMYDDWEGLRKTIEDCGPFIPTVLNDPIRNYAADYKRHPIYTNAVLNSMWNGVGAIIRDVNQTNLRNCRSNYLNYLKDTTALVNGLSRMPDPAVYETILPICEREMECLVACALFPELLRPYIECNNAINAVLQLKWNKKTVDYKKLVDYRFKNTDLRSFAKVMITYYVK